VAAFLEALLELVKMHASANSTYYSSGKNRLKITLPGWFKLTFSTKKMTLENWLSKEDIELLYNYELKNSSDAAKSVG
jgi:hypothetical protein